MPSILDAYAVTADSDPSGSPTISAGSNRAFILGLACEFSGLVTVSSITVGGIAPDVSREDFWENGIEDLHTYVYIWSEDSIASMSGTSISFTDDRTMAKRGFFTVTYQDVDQISLPAYSGTTNQVDVNTTLDITTTSTANDEIIILGCCAGNRTFNDWDTLTERGDVSLNDAARMGVGSGAGGDSTTTVTISAIADLALTTVVLGGGGGIQAQAMHHYRNHGKI